VISKMFFYLLILALICIDQISKYFIKTGMDFNQSIPLVDGIFHLTYIRNFGAAFSILQGKQSFLIAVTFIALAAILLYMTIRRKKNHWVLSLSLSFIVGGGLGNLIDRIRLGYVVDFFDFRVFPVFNVADICVCCGCGLLIYYLFFVEPKIAANGEN
jgi:signal peptidase II